MLVQGNGERFGPIRTVQRDQPTHPFLWNRGSLSLWFDASLRFDAEVMSSRGRLSNSRPSRLGKGKALRSEISQLGNELLGERR